jgi:hypothetical protein
MTGGEPVKSTLVMGGTEKPSNPNNTQGYFNYRVMPFGITPKF